MKSIKAMNALRKTRSATVTGVHCPHTGWWTPEIHHDRTARYLWQGSIMPGVGGQAVAWQLAKADPAGTNALILGINARSTAAQTTDAANALWPDCLD